MNPDKIPLPEAFVQRIMQEYGDAEGGVFIHSLDQPPVVSVTKKSHHVLWDDEEGVAHFPQGVYLKERPSFTLDPRFHLGHYYPQESSSMFVHRIATLLSEVIDVEYVLDLCAAPGGKSILLHQALPDSKVIVSNEVQAKRNVILCENLIKLGNTKSVVAQSPVHQIGGDAKWDLVLLDAPCSGEGMFRKDHSSRKEWSLENVYNCQRVQQDLLEEAARLVKPGGFLIYSTCTFSREENEAQCENLIASECWENWSDIDLPSGAVWKSGEGYRAIQFLPHLAKGEGFFCSVFRRKSVPVKAKSEKQKALKQSFWRKCSGANLKTMSGFVDERETCFFINEQQDVVAYSGPLDVLSWLDRPRMVGIPVGSILRERFVPLQGLITSGLYAQAFQSVELNTSEALDILRGLDWRPEFKGKNGWYLAFWLGQPLAWLKWVGNRFSNHYPLDWRIRKL